MKKLILYIMIPSGILIGLMWYFSPFLLNKRTIRKELTTIPTTFKEKEMKIDTSFVDYSIKTKIRLPEIRMMKMLDTVSNAGSSPDTIYEENMKSSKKDVRKILTVSMPTPKDTVITTYKKKIKVDTVYLEKVIVRQIPAQQLVVKMEKDSGVQEAITWGVGAINGLIASILGLKQLFKRRVVRRRKK